MSVREDQMNTVIADLIRQCTADLNWTVTAEQDSSLADTQKRPDILIRRPHAEEPPIILENEYRLANVEGDVRNKLGQTLRPDLGGQQVSTVIGIHTPKELQDAPYPDQAKAMLLKGAEIQYAAYNGSAKTPSRFPQRGFITGTIYNLVEFLQPAAEPAGLIDQAAKILADNAAAIADTILTADTLGPPIGPPIAAKLRQPWPMSREGNPQQVKSNQDSRRQTATMAAVIIINALAYQQILDGHQKIKGLAQVREQNPAKLLTKDNVVAEFQNILEVNFWPIFHIARELLLHIPAEIANGRNGILERMAKTADAIGAATRNNDIIGHVFQKLIADRKTLKTYYTTPAATTLMAHLAIPEDLDWANPETLGGYKIADYACGSGGIMLACYQRARELHRLHGGKPDELHCQMMEENLTACDIMPAGLHLTASLLSSVAANIPYEKTRCILFPFGGERQVDKNGKILYDDQGNPLKAFDRKGKPRVHLGSISLLKLKEMEYQAVLPPDEMAALAAHGNAKPITVPVTPYSQDLVAMNPPFTRSTKHAPRKTSDSADPKNPAFAAFGTTDAEQAAMKALESTLREGTISDGNAGLGSTFAGIAHNMVKAGGTIALILPTAAMMGGSYVPSKNKTHSWQTFRNLLYSHYDQIRVISIAQAKEADSAFSADSNFADCMILARRTPNPAAPTSQAHFINLNRIPEDNLEAQEMARAIKKAISQSTQTNNPQDIKIGEENIGFVQLEQIKNNQRWATVRIVNPALVNRLRQLTQGILQLPQSNASVALPFTTLGHIAQVGPLARDITEHNRGPFRQGNNWTSDQEYPMLWNHYPNKKADQVGKDPQKKLITKPDSHGLVRKGKEAKAAEMWQTASHLHLNNKFRFNANSTAATCTPVKALGGVMWPSLKMASTELEKALCVWLNSTLGMAIYWLYADRGQDGRGGTSVTAIPHIPALDVTKLSSQQIDALVTIYEELKNKDLKPANEAWRDDVRKELDRRLLKEVLGLDDTAVENLDILRRQWCKEPTVTAAKGTGPTE